jgi:hypothetical protein
MADRKFQAFFALLCRERIFRSPTATRRRARLVWYVGLPDHAKGESPPVDVP